MTGTGTGTGTGTAEVAPGHVRIVTIEQAAAEARQRLDEFEATYGVPSERLREAFTDDEGVLVETGQYLHWMATWQRWNDLRRRVS